jgi:hypothetical protein
MGPLDVHETHGPHLTLCWDEDVNLGGFLSIAPRAERASSNPVPAACLETGYECVGTAEQKCGQHVLVPSRASGEQRHHTREKAAPWPADEALPVHGALVVPCVYQLAHCRDSTRERRPKPL